MSGPGGDRGRLRDDAVGETPDPVGGIVDPDVDLRDPRQRRETRPRQWDVVVAVALGGVLGAEGRFALGAAMPHGAAAFPWATVLINAGGCFLIGVLMVVLLELSSPHRLARPFLGVGVLGGFTTFSTFATDAERMLLQHRPGTAIGYVLTTIVTCVSAVTVATVLTQALGEAIIAARVRRRLRARDRERTPA